MMILIFGLLAFFAGVATVLSIMVNAKLAKQEGMVNGIFVSYVVALLTSTLLCAVMMNTLPTYASIKHLPLPYLLGGLLGVLTTYLFNTVVHKLPAVYVVILRFIGQMLASAVIDYLYFHVFSMGKVIGVALFFAGLMVNGYTKKRPSSTQAALPSE